MCEVLQKWLEPLAIDFETMVIFGIHNLDSSMGKDGLNNEHSYPTGPELALEEVKLGIM